MALHEDVIICFGDSITEGMGMKRPDAYPGVLGSLLEGQFTVLNAGVGGENSYTICSRANALPFTVKEEIIFEKGESEYLSDAYIFQGIHGEKIRYRYGVFGRNLPLSKIFIDGKLYTFRIDRTDHEETDRYVIVRDDTTERLVIPVGAPIKYDYSEVYDYCYCTVLLQGANDGDMPIDIIIDRYKKIASLNERFIALIPHYRGDETAKKFYDVFGENCVNLRKYCLNEYWKDYAQKKSETDRECIQKGKMPPHFTYKNNVGDCHLNEIGYRVLAHLVYKKGIELGYWK